MKNKKLVTGALIGMAAFLLASHTPAQTLEYYLPFDDGTNPTLANDGTVGGTATTTSENGGTPSASTFVPSDIGSAYSEDYPAQGEITLPDSTSNLTLDNSNASQDNMTMTTWIYVTSYNGTGGLFNKTNDSYTEGYWAYINGDGTLSYHWYGGGAQAGVQTTTTIPTGQWEQLTMTSGSASGTTNFYLNGVQMTLNNPYAGTGVMDGSSGLPINVGTVTPSYLPLDGYLDDFALWNGLLSTAEIRALSTAPALINGYNTGILSSLFAAYGSQGSAQEGSLDWTYATGFDTTGHSLGDTYNKNGVDYLWLGGTAADATGLEAAAPEPQTWAFLFLGLGALVLVRRLRRTV